MSEMKILNNGESMEIFRCPSCGEELKPMDLEAFPKCPYCDAFLPRDGATEDFILSPVTRQWIHKQLERRP